MARIAFIGLGKMGAPMAKNLCMGGHELTVFDVNPQAVAQAVEWGAKPAKSALSAVNGTDVVITMLQTGSQVSETCLMPSGIFAQLPKGTLYIDCSSIDIETTRRLHRAAEDFQIAMLDSPVSGGVKGAQSGSLTLMVGGLTKDFARAKPILQLLGKRIIHAGPAGNGQAAKICNNLILGITMIGVSEGFSLAEKLGLDAKKFFEIASQASGQCWVMTAYNPVPGVIDNVPANDHYRPGFTAAMMLKDLKLSQQAAKGVNFSTELAAKATELYQRFVDQDHAEMDFSGIITMME